MPRFVMLTLRPPKRGAAEVVVAQRWASPRVVMPSGKTSVHLLVDSDVFEWTRRRPSHTHERGFADVC